MNRRIRSWAAALALGMVAATTLSACGGDEESTTLQVYAAASLKATFEQLGEEFEEQHDDVEVEFNFAGSSDLVAQIQNGAPADVFASADEANMEKLTAEGLEGEEPRLFATNTLTIVVPPGNPAGVTSLADLTDSDVNLVVCAPQVPCGAASERVREAAGLTWSPRSEEQSVTDVLNKVIAGEADAGLVYVTDAIAAGDQVEAFEFDESDASLNRYPIATVADSGNADLAAEFIELVLSDAGQAVMSEAGFASP